MKNFPRQVSIFIILDTEHNPNFDWLLISHWLYYFLIPSWPNMWIQYLLEHFFISYNAILFTMTSIQNYHFYRFYWSYIYMINH